MSHSVDCVRYLCPVCDLRHSKATIFAHFGTPRLAQSDQFGFIAIIATIVGSEFPKPITKGKSVFCVIFYCYLNNSSTIVYVVTQIEQVVFF